MPLSIGLHQAAIREYLKSAVSAAVADKAPSQWVWDGRIRKIICWIRMNTVWCGLKCDFLSWKKHYMFIACWTNHGFWRAPARRNIIHSWYLRISRHRYRPELWIIQSFITHSFGPLIIWIQMLVLVGAFWNFLECSVHQVAYQQEV